MQEKSVKIVNLLGYDFQLIRGPENAGIKKLIPALEPAARIRTKMIPVVKLHVGETTVPVLKLREEEVVGVPDPKEGVVYVVSGVVASKLRRADVVTLGRIQYENGEFVGARALIQLSRGGTN